MSAEQGTHLRPRALIVEDNQVNRMVAGQMLRRGDIDSDTADGGRSAIERLRQEQFDVVLMDVQMPDMDGFQTARAIRAGEAGEESRTVPIIAMTAYASQDDESACFAAGMDAYLSKPLNMQQFIDTVLSTIEKGPQERRVHAADT